MWPLDRCISHHVQCTFHHGTVLLSPIVDFQWTMENRKHWIRNKEINTLNRLQNIINIISQLTVQLSNCFFCHSQVWWWIILFLQPYQWSHQALFHRIWAWSGSIFYILWEICVWRLCIVPLWFFPSDFPKHFVFVLCLLWQLKQFKADNADVGFGSGTMAVDQAIEKTIANIKWIEQNKESVLNWFLGEAPSQWSFVLAPYSLVI